MDRNTIIGLVLIAAIIFGYGLLTQPSEEQLKSAKRAQDSITHVRAVEKEMRDSLLAVQGAEIRAAEEMEEGNTVADTTDKFFANYGVFAAAAKGTKEDIVLENELLRVLVSTKGGRISSVELKGYKTHDGKPLLLFDGDSSVFGLQFPTVENNVIHTDSLFFKPSSSGFTVEGEDRKSLQMRVSAAEGKYIEYEYTLTGNSYLLDFKANINGMENIIPRNINNLDLEWKVNALRQEHNLEAERHNSTIYYKYSDDEVDYINETKDEKASLKTKVKWVAYKQQYFTSVMISSESIDKPPTLETHTPAGSEKYVKQFSGMYSIAFNHKASEGFPLQFYFGPNHYRTLRQFDLGLEKLIPLGWGIFGWVNRFLVIPVFHFLSKFDLNYGIVILILTIFIKVILLPFTYKAYLSSAKMKVLKPEVDEIQSRKGDDQMKVQQEMMALYRKAGVNPLGGCLPMLFQLPILIAMFRFFPASIELRQEAFLWAHDLSTYDSILDLPFNIPFYGSHVSLFTLLMTVSTIIYTMMNSQLTGSNPQMQQMKWMMYLMPVVFLGVFNSFSAGLSYYYFLANVISIGQQYLFKLFVDEDEIHRKIQEHKKKPQSQKKSKFQQKLEDMAKARGYKQK